MIQSHPAAGKTFQHPKDTPSIITIVLHPEIEFETCEVNMIHDLLLVINY